MVHNLVDRESEWRFLEEAFDRKKAQLIVIYGRRRVGKSFLSYHFVNEKKGVYFLCSKGNEKEQLELLSLKLADYFNDTALSLNPFTRWHDFFTYISEKTKEKTLVLEFDEFPYLMAANPATPSIFQKYWDEKLSTSNIYIILCGSSIGMMETEVLGHRSPLYGRRTGQWKLKPLRFRDVIKFFRDKKISIESIVDLYAVTGGVPYYLVSFDLNKPAIDNIMEYVAKRGLPLLDEGEVLIREELPEAQTYFSILHAMAKGKTKPGDIANHAGLEATALTRYLNNLQRLGFIEKITPVTEKERSKKSLYFIADNFLNFWFRFIYPYRSFIEEEDYGKIKEVLRSEFLLHVSFVFEEVCTQAMEELRKARQFDFEKIGTWWGAYRDKSTNERKTAEIDIVAINEAKKGIVFCECKWQENVDGTEVLNSLKEKSEYVDWNKGERTERYVIFAKSFKGKKTAKKNVFFFDFKDLEGIFGYRKK